MSGNGTFIYIKKGIEYRAEVIVMKFAMKHGGLCSMSFVLRMLVYVLYSCVHGWRFFARVRVMQAKERSNTGVEESTYVLQSGIGTDAATSLEGQPCDEKAL